MRFLLALSVAWTHAGLPKGLSGDLCVTVFFAISGFYMAMVLAERRAYGEVRTFYKQRLLRLFPTYWVLLALSVLLGIWLPSHGWRFALELDLPTAHPWLFLGWILSQALILCQDVLLFFGLDAQGMLAFRPLEAAPGTALTSLNIIPPAWSLSLELMFYLVVPFLARWSTRRLAVLMGASILLRLALAFGADLGQDPWATRFFPSELSFFLLGMLAFRWVCAPGASLLSAGGLLYLGAVAAAVASLAANGFGHVNAKLLSPAAAATLLLTAAIPWLFRLTRSARWDRAIGEYSYPLYLCHVFVFQLFALIMAPGASRNVAMIVAAIGIAVLLTHSIDKPVDRYRHRLMKAG
ncbi:acyltransferase family protein [Roseateles sp. BYS78W]|uniref:Acyltransferase family protein n=1 Tax=Pelomonas candidula TaxID=3299025 RepID=A0ABW7HAS8_9BURK